MRVRDAVADAADGAHPEAGAAEAGGPDAADDDADEAGYFQPIWDPTGTMIAATRVGPGSEPQLVLRDLGVSTAVQVAVPSVAFYLSWSPDGTGIAFTMFVPANPKDGRIYVVTEDGYVTVVGKKIG